MAREEGFLQTLLNSATPALLYTDCLTSAFLRLPALLVCCNSSLAEFALGLFCSSTTPTCLILPSEVAEYCLGEPLSQAVPWVQSCSVCLSPGSTVVAEAPGKDLQMRWHFSSVVLSVGWTELQLGNFRACIKPAWPQQPWHADISHQNIDMAMACCWFRQVESASLCVK